MSNNLKAGDKFPDFNLPDHAGKIVSASDFTSPSFMDRRLGFNDGYPLIIVFSRGFFCPRDQQQMRMLCEFQNELAVNYCRLISISVDEPQVNAAFRAGLGANWTFISDTERKLINKLDILDETEGEYAYRALPFTYILDPDLTVSKIYNGWFFVGRPTLEELRQDLRSIMHKKSYYQYEAYNTEKVKQIRIPQQEWLDDKNRKADLNSHKGTVKWFDKKTGDGMLMSEDTDNEVYFNFTAIPGEGYRTTRPGTPVSFELRETQNGLVAYRVIEIE